ncbi:MAG: ribonuclease III [Pelagibacterales bacterium MED-G40]|nr:MAG: ribonuclease III [Candidatus Pelagibacter sp. TMED203]PDH19516.1 MAG: ribonuclease III [Pelagibacterales bacterium MED-G40]|tara:strand:- start:17040 stop:17708 length:669 start_codon:yes stop_codon:yes gene_type:complete
MKSKKFLYLEKAIGVDFNDFEILKTSMIHKSYNNNVNNEKLEFLGDRVLGLILSYTLLKTYPDEKEGIVDKKFANLVNKKTCYQISKKIGLDKYILVGDSQKKLEKKNEKILSDGLEALIGAIFWDQGLEVAEKFIKKNWKEFLDKSVITVIDSKTKLQEYSLKKYKQLPNYKIYKQSGPKHKPTFKAEVEIKNSKKYLGTGGSKKIAEQNAANKLINDLKI